MSETKRLYSLRKSRRIMQTSFDWYKRKGKTLSSSVLESFESELSQLDAALLRGDRPAADGHARMLESFGRIHFKKSFFEYTVELVLALVFALVIATVVRQMWFELYEIPTGSMRPTFKEQDHLTVTKLSFGINVPLAAEHFYFDPNLVQRSSILIFSGENIPIIDTDTTYFGVFPYKKRYIKRLIGKPGDSIYFYGGKLYNLDKDGNLITDLLDSPWMHKLEHIPFLSFEGLVSAAGGNRVTFRQMHESLGRLTLTSTGNTIGEIFNGKDWIKDQPDAQKSPHQKIQTYSDFWGMRNFAMARLLTKQQVQQYTSVDLEGMEEGELYLELRHNPSLTYPKPRLHGDYRGYSVSLTPYISLIPLKREHLDAIMDNMYTARFVVKDGKAMRYSVEDHQSPTGFPAFSGLANGTYEMYYGKAVKVGWGGITFALPSDSSLYSHDASNIQKLFNLGIEFDTAFAPHAKDQINIPRRYAYFRNGDLYLLGAPILKKGDPILEAFNAREIKKQEQSSATRPYIAFKDYGPPLKDGKPDIEFIRTFGVTVPEGKYLVLGDNHAMSSDSRVFGFVPQNNLQGAPSLIIWPPGDRIGPPKQKPYPIFNVPRLIVWGIVLLIAIIWYSIHRSRQRQPIFRKLNFAK